MLTCLFQLVLSNKSWQKEILTLIVHVRWLIWARLGLDWQEWWRVHEPKCTKFLSISEVGPMNNLPASCIYKLKGILNGWYSIEIWSGSCWTVAVTPCSIPLSVIGPVHTETFSCVFVLFQVMCRATYLRSQITLVPVRWFKTLTRDCILSNAFITFYICATTYMTHLTFISSPLYVYSLNLYGTTREDILYHWHISWDYTIIILLSHLSHDLFFPILVPIQLMSCVICG